MTFQAWLFLTLLLGTLMRMLVNRRQREEKVISDLQLLEEHLNQYHVVYAHYDALLAFVQEFVDNTLVVDVLRLNAESLDRVCKESVNLQQRGDLSQDPDRIYQKLTENAEQVTCAKKNFWRLVEIVKKANEVLRDIRQFSIPDSHKELLKSSAT